MSKTYILQKDLPGVSAGAEITPMSGLAWGYRISQCVHYEWANDYIIAHPDWFKPKEENKSNDSFQWTDELVKEFAEFRSTRLHYPVGYMLKEFIASHTQWSREKFIEGMTSTTPKPQAEKSENKLTRFETKKIGQFWYCYATHRGYDYTFCSDNEYHAIELAKRIMDKNGWLSECYFPERAESKPQAEKDDFKWVGVYGVDINWEIKWDKSDLGKVMKAKDCRFIGNKQECEEFIQKYKPQAENKPDWEIVALKEESGNIYEKPAYPPPYWDSIIEHIKNRSTLKKIHSVQRLSDNSVFSVDENTGIGVIREFKILDGKMNAKGDYGFVDLMLVHKLPPQPQKLFTTEDGKNIFEGDRYWFIWIKEPARDQVCFRAYTATAHQLEEGERNSPDARFFSTKEAAEKYIAESKPQPQKEESSCKSPSGNCVNHLACNREDKCIYEAREQASAPDKRIEVFGLDKYTPVFAYRDKKYQFVTSEWIPEEKFPVIKQAIEQVLNDDKKTIGIKCDWGTSFISKEEYDKEIDAMCEAAFNAAREDAYSKTARMGPGPALIDQALHLLKYKSYEDYKQSKQ